MIQTPNNRGVAVALDPRIGGFPDIWVSGPRRRRAGQAQERLGWGRNAYSRQPLSAQSCSVQVRKERRAD